VDIGYTVLIIPRSQIAKISKSDARKPPAKKAAPSKTASGTEEAESREIAPALLHAGPDDDSPKRA